MLLNGAIFLGLLPFAIVYYNNVLKAQLPKDQLPKGQLPKGPTTPAPPAPLNCGAIKTPESRIFGGREANPGELPWVASLQVQQAENPARHVCVASILNERFLLTSANCIG